MEGKKKVIRTYAGKEYVIELLNKEVYSCGDGVSWIINECRDSDFYEIVLWKYDEIGYRFYLEKNKLRDFGLYLQECCEYMLAHGDPI